MCLRHFLPMIFPSSWFKSKVNCIYSHLKYNTVVAIQFCIKHEMTMLSWYMPKSVVITYLEIKLEQRWFVILQLNSIRENLLVKWPLTGTRIQKKSLVIKIRLILISLCNNYLFHETHNRQPPITHTWGHDIAMWPKSVYIGSKMLTSNGSWCIGIKGEMSGTVCVTFTWEIYIYELFIAFVCFVVCSLL